MRNVLLLVVLVLPTATPARAQDTTARVSRFIPDSAQARADSLDRRAQRDRERARCERHEAIQQGTTGALVGAFAGATLGAIPATILSLTKHHDAARLVFWTPTAAGAIYIGVLGAALGTTACN